MADSKRITMKDVAREAGVSLGTVSNVINGASVGRKYQLRVEQAIKKLGYRVNRQAQALRSSQSSLVEIILPGVRHPVYSALTDSLCRELALHGRQPLLCITGGDPDLEQLYLDQAEQQSACGIICLTDHAGLTVPEGIPAVSIDRTLGPGIPCVTSDSYSGGLLAAQRLIRNGCKSLAFLRADPPLPHETDKRRDGFVCACADARVPFECMGVREGDAPSVLEDFLRAHLHEGQLDFDGLFCATDPLAAQIRRTLGRMGLEVSRDIQIIGCGGVKEFPEQEYPCSTIVLPVEEMARLCVSLILPSHPQQMSCSLQLPVSYAFGGTTREASADPCVSA